MLLCLYGVFDVSAWLRRDPLMGTESELPGLSAINPSQEKNIPPESIWVTWLNRTGPGRPRFGNLTSRCGSRIFSRDYSLDQGGKSCGSRLNPPGSDCKRTEGSAGKFWWFWSNFRLCEYRSTDFWFYLGQNYFRQNPHESRLKLKVSRYTKDLKSRFWFWP